MASCSPNASSNCTRASPAVTSSSVSGRCTARYAVGWLIRSASRRTHSGSGSSIPSRLSRASETQLAIVQVRSLAVAG